MNTHYKFVLLSQGSQAIFSLWQLLANGVSLQDILCISFSDQPTNRPYVEFLKYIGVGYVLRPKQGAYEDILAQTSYDYILSVSWHRILSPQALQYAHKENINFHPGRLPYYQGCFSTCWSIIHQEKYVGYTWHIMDKKIDAGDILLRGDIEIADKNAQQLYYEIFSQGLAKIGQVIQACENNTRFDNRVTKGTYYMNKLPYEGIINPHWDDGTVARFIRAMYFPPLKGAMLKTANGTFECHTMQQYLDCKQL